MNGVLLWAFQNKKHEQETTNYVSYCVDRFLDAHQKVLVFLQFLHPYSILADSLFHLTNQQLIVVFLIQQLLWSNEWLYVTF